MPKCRNVNTPGGCQYKSYEACPYSHEHEGRWCRSMAKRERCSADPCFYLHPKGSALSVITQDFADGASPALTPRTPGAPCPFVNKPGGCSGQEDQSCPYNHFNENKECKKHKSKDGCKFKEKCNFLHRTPDRRAPQQGYKSSSSKDKNQDLRPIIDQVLQNPMGFGTCAYVNKSPTGCYNRQNCTFNHTLASIDCPDTDQSGTCSRQQDCPLLHVSALDTDQQQQPGLQDKAHAGAQDVATGKPLNDDQKKKALFEQGLDVIKSTKRKFQSAVVPMDMKRMHLEQSPTGDPTAPRSRGQQQAQQPYSSQHQPGQSPAYGHRNPSQLTKQLLSPSYLPYHAHHYQPSQRPQPPANAPKGPRATNRSLPSTRPGAETYEAPRVQQQASQQGLGLTQGSEEVRVMGAAAQTYQGQAGLQYTTAFGFSNDWWTEAYPRRLLQRRRHGWR